MKLKSFIEMLTKAEKDGGDDYEVFVDRDGDNISVCNVECLIQRDLGSNTESGKIVIWS